MSENGKSSRFDLPRTLFYVGVTLLAAAVLTSPYFFYLSFDEVPERGERTTRYYFYSAAAAAFGALLVRFAARARLWSEPAGQARNPALDRMIAILFAVAALIYLAVAGLCIAAEPTRRFIARALGEGTLAALYNAAAEIATALGPLVVIALALLFAARAIRRFGPEK